MNTIKNSKSEEIFFIIYLSRTTPVPLMIRNQQGINGKLNFKDSVVLLVIKRVAFIFLYPSSYAILEI
jgi:hypothetical protein